MFLDLRHCSHPAQTHRGARAPGWVSSALFGSFLFLLAGPLCAQDGAETAAPSHALAMPRFESNSSDAFFHINLASGDSYLTDRLDAPPPRTRLLTQNISREIGLSTGMSIGDLLLAPIRNGDGSLRAAILVESSTGYVAYFDEPGRGSKLGELTVAVGRPFEPLANNDRSLTLLPRRDASGRTEGAYLYQATTGKTLYLGGLRKLEPDGQVQATSPWPTLSFRAVAVPLLSPREQTLGYWVADPTTGDNHRVSVSRNNPTQISSRQDPTKIFDAFSGKGPHSTYAPLVALGIEDRDDHTRSIFLLAVSSGEMAIWYGIDNQSGAPRLVKLGRNLYDVLGNEPAPVPRTLTALPRLSDDGVVGIYLLDSYTRNIVLVSSLDQPGAVTLSVYGKFGG